MKELHSNVNHDMLGNLLTSLEIQVPHPCLHWLSAVNQVGNQNGKDVGFSNKTLSPKRNNQMIDSHHSIRLNVADLRF